MNLVKAHVTSIKAWLALLGPVGYAVWKFEQPSINTFIANHPSAPIAVVVVALIAALNSNKPGGVDYSKLPTADSVGTSTKTGSENQ